MKKSKRILAGIMATVVLVSTAACGNKATETKTEDDKYEYMASSQFFKLESDGEYTSSQIVSVDSQEVNYIEIKYNDEYITEKIIFHTDSFKNDEKKSVELKLLENTIQRENVFVSRKELTSDGSLYLFSSMYNQETGEEKEFLDIFDKDGNNTYSGSVDSVREGTDLQYISNTVVGDDGNMYFSGDNTVVVADKTGKVITKLTVNGWVDNMFAGKDGNVYASFYENLGNNQNYVIKKIDVQKGEFVDTKVSLDSSSSRTWFGCDEKTLFSSTSNKVSLVDIETGEEINLWNWLDIDYCDVFAENIWKNEDGSYGFARSAYSLDVPQLEVVTLKKELITEENKREKIVLGVEGYLDEPIRDAITKFNKTNGKYKITIKNYYEEYGYENADAMLKADITAKKLDLICGSMLDPALLSKNVYEDLTPYLESDPGYKEEEFFTNIMEAAKIGGKLYFIAPSFTVISMMVSDDILKGKDSWTIDDLAKAQEEFKDKIVISGADQETALGILAYYGCKNLIDYSDCTCHFDTDEFKKILEVSKSFPEKFDYDNFDEWEMIQSGDVLSTMNYLYSIDEMGVYKSLFNGKAKLVGYPSAEGSGHKLSFNNMFSIMSNSNKKEGAWQFISTLYSDEFYSTAKYFDGFPIKKKSFDIVMENKIEMSGGGSWGMGNVMVEVPKATKQDIEDLKKIIGTVDSMMMLDEKIYEMINEEAKPYFANSKTLEETCDTIQKRVSLYLSETN